MNLLYLVFSPRTSNTISKKQLELQVLPDVQTFGTNLPADEYHFYLRMTDRQNDNGLFALTVSDLWLSCCFGPRPPISNLVSRTSMQSTLCPHRVFLSSREEFCQVNRRTSVRLLFRLRLQTISGELSFVRWILPFSLSCRCLQHTHDTILPAANSCFHLMPICVYAWVCKLNILSTSQDFTSILHLLITTCTNMWALSLLSHLQAEMHLLLMTCHCQTVNTWYDALTICVPTHIRSPSVGRTFLFKPCFIISPSW